ncbi:hypothetical protein AKJ16_DCAP17335 [Drosera capensis]
MSPALLIRNASSSVAAGARLSTRWTTWQRKYFQQIYHTLVKVYYYECCIFMYRSNSSTSCTTTSLQQQYIEKQLNGFQLESCVDFDAPS